MSSSSSFDAEKIAALQRQLGDDLRSTMRAQNDQEIVESSAFVDHQRQVFDGMAKWFASDEAVPEDLHPTYQYLATRIIEACCHDGTRDESSTKDEERRTIRLLDVGTGTGALIPFYQNAVHTETEREVELRITGVDLSSNMIAEAKEKYRHLLAEANQEESTVSRTVIDDLVVSNVLDYQLSDDDSKFDAIVMNSCFGNFLNPRAVMEHLAARLLRSAPTTLVDAAGPEPSRVGRIFVTHPLGADFVQMLHEECADTVPHPLPTRRVWQSDLLLGLPLVLERWEIRYPPDASSGSTNPKPIYYAEIESVRYHTLPNVMRMRGSVASGFGRGGKKLGFPTANLGPSHVFESALESVETGVYFGWATVEPDSDVGTRPVVHKAVVNVGYSPTFQEQNPVKIVEAHLILDESAQAALGDFYNRTMRLQLIGYLRPELKFPSFPALIAQITADRDDASRALDRSPYCDFQEDGFLRSNESAWIGSTGGNFAASWEFTSLRSTLEALLDQAGE